MQLIFGTFLFLFELAKMARKDQLTMASYNFRGYVLHGGRYFPQRPINQALGIQWHYQSVDNT